MSAMTTPLFEKSVAEERLEREYITSLTSEPFDEWKAKRLAREQRWRERAARERAEEDLLAQQQEVQALPVAPTVDEEDDEETEGTDNSLSDESLAIEVAKALSDKVLYVSEWRSWVAYKHTMKLRLPNGKDNRIPAGIWQKSDEAFAIRTASQYLAKKAKGMKGLKDGTRLLLGSTSKAKAVLTQAKGTDYLTVSADVFDRNPDIILTADRTVVDLRTGETRQVSPFDLFTKRTPIRYNPKADDADLKRMMKALPSDKANFLLDVAGQSLTGHQPSRGFILFLNGGGSNGKSAIIAALARVFGGYGGRPSQAVLLKSASGSNAEHHLTAYRGLRGAFFDELPDRRHLDATVVKRIVATPDLTAAGKFEHAQTFPVIASNFVSTNYLPQVSETDEGTWSRLITMTFPFHYTATPKQEGDLHADPRFAATAIRSESMTPDAAPLFEALLARLVESAMDWYKRRQLAMTQNVPEFDVPDSVKRETAEWRGTTDKFLLWAQECLELDDGEDAKDFFTLTDDLYTSFKQYCESNGVSWVKKADFKTAINAHWWFRGHGLTFEDRVRTSQLRQHYWQNPRDSWRDSYRPAEAATRANLMRGVKIVQ